MISEVVHIYNLRFQVRFMFHFRIQGTADPAFVMPFHDPETHDGDNVKHLTIQVKDNLIFFSQTGQ